jgi:hypothetical protein
VVGWVRSSRGFQGSDRYRFGLAGYVGGVKAVKVHLSLLG